jgi:hypothetical protein
MSRSLKMDLKDLILDPEGWTKLDVVEDIRRRARILQAADKDPGLRSAFRSIAKKDPLFFVDNFCWIYEPRAGRDHIIPWRLYPHERDMIHWLEERFKEEEDGLIEKSRDMGATWTFCVWTLWHYLFDDEFSALIGSRKEDLVDNKLPDSIFGKYDYILAHLPSFLLPAGFDMGKHRTYMKIVNPENHNALTGESTNPAFSRSGRYSVIGIDEFAFVERSYSIWQAAGDSTSCRFPLSTPNGKGNKFAELALETDIKKLKLHWSLHPEKDMAWYEKEKLRRTDQEVAQELDISYERSTRGQVFKNEWEELKAQKRLANVPWDPMLPVSTGWDFGIGDATAIIFCQETKTGAVHLVDYYEHSGASIDHYIKVIQGKPYRYFQHYGDITIKRNELGTGRSVWEILKQSGILIRGKMLKKKEEGINAAKMLLRKTWVDSKLTDLIDAIENYHFPFDEDKQVYSDMPEHDWSCLGPDTKIRTLRGWFPVKDILPDTWVWSYDHNLHRLIPAKCSFVGTTRLQTETVEVGLDNGKSIFCTPDHRFMTRDEGWTEAGELKPGDSLMPFYEVLNRDYLQIDLNDGTFADEHRYVYSFTHGPYDQTKHVDHINGNKHDNDPSNLQLMSHQDHVSKTFSGIPNGQRHLVAKTPQKREVYGRDMLWRFCSHCGNEYYGSYKSWYCSSSCLKSRHSKRDVVRNKKYRNHKVRYVKSGPIMDTWDMEVPGTNCFVAEGVIVHNSHCCDAIQYFALNFKSYQEIQKKPMLDPGKYKFSATTY